MHLHKVLLCLVLVCVGQNALGRKIIKGIKGSTNPQRYMASLQNDGKHVCGGFLLRKNFVLTSAECEVDKNTLVKTGCDNLKHPDSRGERIDKRCTKPDGNGGDDIVILKLLPLGSEERNICQAEHIELPNDDKIKNKTCLAVGWVLKDKIADKVVTTSCIVQNSSTEKFICAFQDDGGISQYDFGGPLVCDDKAVGVMSNKNRTESSYVYINISKNMTWIKDVIDGQSNESCESIIKQI